MVQEKFAFKGSANRLTAGDISYDPRYSSQDLIIFLHGYKGFKDWGCWNLMAKYFVEKAYAFLKFNFSHNGGTVSEYVDFPDLDAFAANRYSYELNDVRYLIDHVRSNKQFSGFNTNKFHLVGHSRGGGIALLAAGHYNDFKSISTLAAVSDFERRFSHDLNKWKQDGTIFVQNGRTRQEMPHNYSFYEDFKENESDLDIEKWAKKITVPGLVIHAKDDHAVAYEESLKINNWLGQVKLVNAEGGHTFNSKHPWNDNRMPDELLKVCQSLHDFYRGI
jgi:pimeloyl-ACP methyl ester carboxylesterase